MATSSRYVGQDLLPYYERELAALRGAAKEFAAQHPLIASRLNLEDGLGEDPHVERLLQGCAYLAARIQRRLHDDHPLFTSALLGLIYPQLTRPIPSFSVIGLEVDYGLKGVTETQTVPAGSGVVFPASGGVRCSFRTCYPVELVPLTMTECQLLPVERAPAPYVCDSASAVLVMKFASMGSVDLAQLPVDRLRLFLDLGPDAFDLHELLLNRVVDVIGRLETDQGDEVLHLGAHSIRPVGFEAGEALLGAEGRHLDGYRLLLEYFCFPQKFLFVDLVDLGRLVKSPCSAFEIAVSVRAPVRKERLTELCRAVRRNSLKLGCTPIVNLFEHSAVPIRTTGQRQGYSVVPKGRPRSAYEVYALTSIVRLRAGSAREDAAPIKPLFAFSADDLPGSGAVFWVEHRRFADAGEDKGTEVELDFLYRNGNVPNHLEDTFSVNFLASNRDLPASLPFGEAVDDVDPLELASGGGVDRVRCLVRPTPAVRTHLGVMNRWEFISHLSFNHLSIVEGGEEALRGVLSLYNLRGAADARRQINAVHRLKTKSVVRPMGDSAHRAFVRGLRVEMLIDEAGFSGANPYLFSAVIARLFESFTAINTFVELSVVLKNREGEFASWAPNLGTAHAL